MMNLKKLVLLSSYSMTLFSCSENENKAKISGAATSDNKYTTSLRDAAEKFSNAEHNHDTTFFNYVDSSFAVTARGETHVIPVSAFNDFRKGMTEQFRDTTMTITTTYDIKEVEAGSSEPVWAGYDKGEVVQTTVSKDGKYNRKMTGPYYRAWKLDNGKWKCYDVVYMAFTCEGNDCK